MKTFKDFQDQYRKLDQEAGQYNRSEFDKVYKFLDDSMNFDVPLQSGDAVDEALKKAGYLGNEKFVSDFKRYREIEQQARDLQLRALSLPDHPAMQVLQTSATKEDANEGWKFFPIKIIVPDFMEQSVADTLEQDYKGKKRLYATHTDIDFEDESIDELLMIDAYGVKCRLEPVVRELQSYKIDSFLADFGGFKSLLLFLKHTMLYISDNTDKPNKIRNEIAKIIKGFDVAPGVGLVWQILILQGLISWLGGINFNEGDSATDDAQILYDWLCMQLVKKEAEFCHFYWSDQDKEQLKPLCDYLYSTEIGKIVQKHLFGKASEPTQNSQTESNAEKSDLCMLHQQQLPPLFSEYLISDIHKMCNRVQFADITSDGFKAIINDPASGGGKLIIRKGENLRVYYLIDRLKKTISDDNRGAIWLWGILTRLGIKESTYKSKYTEVGKDDLNERNKSFKNELDEVFRRFSS